MLKGSCLCGAVAFEVEALPGKVFNCHCSQCRKSHGAAFATQAFARGETLRFIRGEDDLTAYTGHGGVRVFCRHCGSRLMNHAPNKGLYLSVALSCIDNLDTFAAADLPAPVAHAFVDSKAPWHTPSAEIPTFPELPDGTGL